MNRRAFLQRPAAFASAETLSPYANKRLPLQRAGATGSTLAAYAGPWGYAQAAHLLRRAMFGPTRAEITTAAGTGLAAVLDGLLTAAPAPAPPVNVSATDTSVPIGQTWVTQPFDQTLQGARSASLRDWWLGQQLNQTVSLSEQMTLFWHNHFVVQLGTINDARMGYAYVQLLRRHALGNIRQLAQDITVNPAMLRYLNGNQSVTGAPNENYGRELLELFTVGKGPLIGTGNYTNYTEADVQAAARVLTGWRDDRVALNGYFTASRHDAKPKQFSGAFGNAVIAPNGADEYKDLINLIFAQAETARFLVRKLYRWFVYYLIDDQTESDVVGPLAQLLVQSNFEVGPVLRKLFSSEHFFDVASVGCRIKSPLDFTVGLVRQMEVDFPPASSVVAQYAHWDYLYSLATVQQQTLGDPPNVAGWAAYYQVPQFHELWINAVTLPRRNQTTDLFIGKGIARGGVTAKIDPVALVLALPPSTASDPNLVIAEFVQLMVPLALTAAQLDFLKNALIPGLPDFEWFNEWTAYAAMPTVAAKKAAVTTKLQAMLRSLMGLAEYHLS